MRKYLIFLILGCALTMSAFAQKDKSAWKEKQNLERQYSVFKENLNFWDGNYILNERQLDEFYSAFKDSITSLENETAEKATSINILENELEAAQNELENTKEELAASIENQNTLQFFGMNVEKSVYTITMISIILALLVLLGIVFLLYKRSNKVTVQTKKDYAELKQEFEIHKKNALERYTKINTELHNTRMELNKR